jgi:hypothetical protein
MSPEDKNAIIVERLTERKALAVDLATTKEALAKFPGVLNDIARSVEMIELYGSGKEAADKIEGVDFAKLKALVTEYRDLSAKLTIARQVIANMGLD